VTADVPIRVLYSTIVRVQHVRSGGEISRPLPVVPLPEPLDAFPPGISSSPKCRSGSDERQHTESPLKEERRLRGESSSRRRHCDDGEEHHAPLFLSDHGRRVQWLLTARRRVPPRSSIQSGHSTRSVRVVVAVRAVKAPTTSPGNTTSVTVSPKMWYVELRRDRRFPAGYRGTTRQRGHRRRSGQSTTTLLPAVEGGRLAVSPIGWFSRRFRASAAHRRRRSR